MKYLPPLRVTLAAGTLLLGGCTSFGQPAATSSLAIPQAWRNAAATASPSTQPPGEWWRQFNDPVLDEFIAAALKAAPDMRTARAQLHQARATRDLELANLYPSLGVSASASRSKSGTQAGGTGKTQTLLAAGFDASWEPPIFSGQRDAVVGAEADLAASQASLAATHVSLAAEVALEYATLRTYQQQLALTRDNVASQGETLQITEWRQQAGLVTALNVDQARTTLEQSRALIPAIEINRAAAEHRLAALTGQAPGTLANKLRDEKPLPTAPDTIAVAIPADTIRQRPDIRAAEQKLLAEIARSAEQRAARYPSLSLSGTWGWKAFSLSALGGGDAVAGSLLGSLAVNLFDGGRIRSRTAIQDAVQEQALVNWESTILSALEDVENALVAYARGKERVAARRRAAASARSAAQLARTLFEAGTVDFMQVLDAQRTRLSAEEGLANAEGDLLVAVIRLYKAMGGGWRNEDAFVETRS